MTMKSTIPVAVVDKTITIFYFEYIDKMIFMQPGYDFCFPLMYPHLRCLSLVKKPSKHGSLT